MYKLFMAFRYLRAHKIIYFSIVGVALGIMTIVIVTSIMGGFTHDMRERIRGMQTHILVTTIDHASWFKDYGELGDALAKVPHVVGCAPRVEFDAQMGRRGTRRLIHFVGILPEKERGVSEIEAYFRKGKKRFDFARDGGGEGTLPGVVVGRELFGEREVHLMTVREASPMPLICSKEFEEVGRFHSGMGEYDSTYLFMHLSAAQDFLQVKDPPRVNVLAIAVDDYEKNGQAVRGSIVKALHERRPCASPYAHRRGECGLYKTMTWEESRRILLQAVEVEKAMQIIIMFLIVLVAGFNIIAIYTLVVRSKIRDIGILRALGATEEGVLSIFLTSGGLCGLIGSIFGIALGLLTAHSINGISDFIRVVSREMNGQPRGTTGMAVLTLFAAGMALVWNWLVFYKTRRPHPWVRIGAALLMFGAAAWFSTAWMPGYKPVPYDYDPVFASGARTRLAAGVVLFWIFFTGTWRILDRWRRHPGWIFFGFFGTLVFAALLLAILATLAIAVSILALNPPSGWPGLELFSRRIYYLDRIPVYIDYKAIGFIVGVTLVVSLVFSVYPAMRAARCNPIEAIRDE